MTTQNRQKSNAIFFFLNVLYNIIWLSQHPYIVWPWHKTVLQYFVTHCIFILSWPLKQFPIPVARFCLIIHCIINCTTIRIKHTLYQNIDFTSKHYVHFYDQKNILLSVKKNSVTVLLFSLFSCVNYFSYNPQSTGKSKPLREFLREKSETSGYIKITRGHYVQIPNPLRWIICLCRKHYTLGNKQFNRQE